MTQIGIRTSLLVVLVLLAIPAAAADISGAVSLRVIGPDGEPLTDAAVRIETTGHLRTMTTDSTGHVVAGGLPPGLYDVGAHHPAHGTVVLTLVRVDARRTSHLELTLDREPDEEVTVRRDTPLLDTWSYALASSFLSEELRQTVPSSTSASLLSRVPGILTSAIDLGGSAAGSLAPVTVRGAAGAPAVEWSGFAIDHLTPGNEIPLLGIDEVRVETAGARSDLASATGVMVLVPRTGRDELEGRIVLRNGWGEESQSGDLPVATAITQAALFASAAMGEHARASVSAQRLDVERSAGAPTETDAATAIVDGSFGRFLLRGAWLSLDGAPGGSGGTLAGIQGSAVLSPAVTASVSAARTDVNRTGDEDQLRANLEWSSGGRVWTLARAGVDVRSGDGARDDAGWAEGTMAGEVWSVHAGVRFDEDADTGISPRIGAAWEIQGEMPAVVRGWFSRYEEEAGSSLDEYVISYEQQVVPEMTWGATAMRRSFERLDSRHDGLDVFAQKRLSNAFLLRGGFSWFDGDAVTPEGGAESLDARWAFHVSGLVQLPLEWTVAGSYSARDGVAVENEGVPSADERLPGVSTLDLRAAREVRFGAIDVGFSVEVFNALGRERELRVSRDPDGVREVLARENPRVISLGVTLAF